jgi:hypothetical protein
MGSDGGAAIDPSGELPPGQEAAEVMAAPATLVIDRRRHASVRSRIATAAVQTAVRPLIRAVGPAIGDDLLERAARFERLLGRIRPPRGTHTEAVAFEDFGAEWVHGAGVARPRDRVILYLHGGGWLCCGLNTHRALTSRISAAAGIPALSVDYRMAPAVPFEEEVEDCLTAYRWLLERSTEARDITIMGDSAGGYLTLATALRARADGLPMPAALVALSGCFDLRRCSWPAPPRCSTAIPRTCPGGWPGPGCPAPCRPGSASCTCSRHSAGCCPSPARPSPTSGHSRARRLPGTRICPTSPSARGTARRRGPNVPERSVAVSRACAWTVMVEHAAGRVTRTRLPVPRHRLPVGVPRFSPVE